MPEELHSREVTKAMVLAVAMFAATGGVIGWSNQTYFEFWDNLSKDHQAFVHATITSMNCCPKDF